MCVGELKVTELGIHKDFCGRFTCIYVLCKE